MTKEITLYWCRQDLRIKDNPALNFAASQGAVLPVYICDSTCPQHYQPGAASRYWLHQSLQALSAAMQEHLLLLDGDPLALLKQLVTTHAISRVVWNRCYEPWQIARDKKIKQQLKDMGVQVHSFQANLLWEPWTVTKADGSPYKVFTPFYRKGCLKSTVPRLPQPQPDNIHWARVTTAKSLHQLGLLSDYPWYTKLDPHWQPGEEGASLRLSQFLQEAAYGYKSQRDMPAKAATSRLSAHLHFGEISINQLWYALIDAFDNNIDDPNLDCFLSELGWREFSAYLLYHWPQMTQANFNPKFDIFPWQQNSEQLQRWQRGQTGIPIVDAGMRELWQTGTMHNRVRMIVGSFLVKNLLMDWRQGERWFWDCLLDADLASNVAGWQWVAGSGADAAPYFRIFNPVLQGEKFDKHGDYIKRYCPELALMPDKYIHHPWDAPQAVLHSAKVVLGQTYLKPMVDLKTSRQRALEAFSALKQG